jgi:hypothetical protein
MDRACREHHVREVLALAQEQLSMVIIIIIIGVKLSQGHELYMRSAVVAPTTLKECKGYSCLQPCIQHRQSEASKEGGISSL